jgi:hypothetical protein
LLSSAVQGVTFRIDEVELDPELRRVYNKAVDLWVEMLHKFTEAADLIGRGIVIHLSLDFCKG